EVEEEEEREEEEAAGQMEEEEEEGEQQEEEKEVRRGHPRGRALFLPAVSCLGRAGGRRPGVPQGPRPAAEPPGAGWPGRTRAGPAASRREKKKTHGGRSAAMCLALRTGWGPRWRTLRRLAYACAAPCSSLAARATLPGPRAAPGGPGTGGAGPAARARCGASAGVRSSLGGCTEKHPLCPDGRRPGRDIGSGAASRRPTAWWGPRRRQRWPYSVLTSSPPDLQAKQGCPENPDRRGDSGDRVLSMYRAGRPSKAKAGLPGRVKTRKPARWQGLWAELVWRQAGKPLWAPALTQLH
ncbi:unnamed protein product, partial [Prorocentrum cordatum]